MITLLDGGIGQELIARTGTPQGPLWATQAMLDRPDLLRALHADYFAAGAAIATVNSYALHRDRLAPLGLEPRLADLLALALEAAHAARAAHGRGRVAGSIGPLGASYRPDLHPPGAAARALYAEVATLLAPRCDLLIAETVASLAHACALIAGAAPVAARHGIPFWLSVTVADDDGTRLRSGEPVAALAGLMPGVAAVMANCATPEAMTQALPVLASLGRPFGAAANGFAHATSDFLAGRGGGADRPPVSPRRYAAAALDWAARGATLIGGCCETGPAHIAATAAALSEAGHRLA
jgi:homocysteine S-methyltransferase